jgi:hypothetical protein
MSRLKRFEDHRFIGDRRTMKVYDCDDESQFAVLEELVSDGDLTQRNGLQTFAPDDLAEAANRSFRPVS